MLGTIRVLFDGANARAEDRLKDTYAVELIEQRIREAEGNLSAAKVALASLIQRKRAEERLADALVKRITSMTTRAEEALQNKREDLAREAAQAIADMENEKTTRSDTIDRLESRIVQLRSSVEAAHRRIIDLKQGAIAARAVKREQAMQKRLNRTLVGNSAADEAETLINRVLGQDDPFEQNKILHDIDRSLTGSDAESKLADAGFGDPLKTTADQVLDRLKSKK